MKICITTPTFGKPRYLKTCVESVIKQSLPTKHVIYGGNLQFDQPPACSTTLIVNVPLDPGMVACWSNAASLTETEYIGFLADDNSLQPHFAERMVNFLDNNSNCDMVFCNQYHMDAEGRIDFEKSKAFTKQFGRHLLPPGIIEEKYYPIILEKGAIPLEGCVIRRKIWDIYGPFKTEARGAFDHEFVYRLLINGVRMAFIPEYLMNFRWHDGAYTSRAKKDHLIGTIWSYDSLMHQSKKEYSEIFKTKSIFLKGRLLRYKISFRDRITLMKTLILKEKGVRYILTNSIVGVVRIALRFNLTFLKVVQLFERK
jgi:GT2 family glycosyltransferase